VDIGTSSRSSPPSGRFLDYPWGFLAFVAIAALFGGRGNRLLKMQLKWALAPVLLSIGGGYARAWNCQGRGHREA
jgi:hypothetical protein